ncbi:MAG: hypothetical protein IBX68_00050 [Dehalococcoidia bacterium]|nr:hypothetical protein [Dehalococcoidia bacterium]
MATQYTEKKTIFCPNSHQCQDDSAPCPVCGLPVIDCETELDLLLKALGDEEKRLKFARERIFMGVGDQGCRLVQNFFQASRRDLKNSGFLMIDASGEARHLAGLIPETGASKDYVISPLSLHLLPGTAGKQVGYFGLGQQLACGDPGLDDRLLRSGIRSTVRKQAVFLLSALGGGTGSGASPCILERARCHNSHARTLVIALMPAATEQDGAQFNAVCSLSRLIDLERGPVADMVVLVEHDRLMKIRGVGEAGEEIAREELVSRLLGALAGTVTVSGRGHTEPGYLAKMSRSLGIHAFVPCVAIGRSLEIFGSIRNILESALLCPLAPVDRQEITLSHMVVNVPEKVAASMHEQTLRSEINRWNKETFPRLKGSTVQLSQIDRSSDRVDVYLVLGGMPLAVLAKTAREGYERFKTVARSRTWEKEFGNAEEILSDTGRALESYDAKLGETPIGSPSDE